MARTLQTWQAMGGEGRVLLWLHPLLCSHATRQSRRPGVGDSLRGAPPGAASSADDEDASGSAGIPAAVAWRREGLAWPCANGLGLSPDELAAVPDPARSLTNTQARRSCHRLLHALWPRPFASSSPSSPSSYSCPPITGRRRLPLRSSHARRQHAAAPAQVAPGWRWGGRRGSSSSSSSGGRPCRPRRSRRQSRRTAQLCSSASGAWRVSLSSPPQLGPRRLRGASRRTCGGS